MRVNQKRRLGFKDVEYILKELKEIERSSRMVDVLFDSQIETSKIKEKTRLYRSFYLIEPTKELIKYIEEHVIGEDTNDLRK